MRYASNINEHCAIDRRREQRWMFWRAKQQGKSGPARNLGHNILADGPNWIGYRSIFKPLRKHPVAIVEQIRALDFEKCVSGKAIPGKNDRLRGALKPLSQNTVWVVQILKRPTGQENIAGARHCDGKLDWPWGRCGDNAGRFDHRVAGIGKCSHKRQTVFSESPAKVSDTHIIVAERFCQPIKWLARNRRQFADAFVRLKSREPEPRQFFILVYARCGLRFFPRWEIDRPHWRRRWGRWCWRRWRRVDPNPHLMRATPNKWWRYRSQNSFQAHRQSLPHSRRGSIPWPLTVK